MQLRISIKKIKCYTKQLVNFWISLAGLASIITLFWYFDPIEYLAAKIIITLLAAFIPAHLLLDGLSNDKDRHKFSGTIAWFSAYSIAVLVIAFGAEINATSLVINGVSLLVAVPGLLLYWKTSQNERILKLWFVPIIVLASLYLVPLITTAGITLEFLLVPLPVASYGCVVWAFATRWTLERARKAHDCAIWGPGMQSLTMFLLVAPFIILMMLAVNALGFDDVWVAVSGAIVGILFGGAVSEPFRRFMLDLGCLSKNAKCEGTVKTDR